MYVICQVQFHDYQIQPAFLLNTNALNIANEFESDVKWKLENENETYLNYDEEGLEAFRDDFGRFGSSTQLGIGLPINADIEKSVVIVMQFE